MSDDRDWGERAIVVVLAWLIVFVATLELFIVYAVDAEGDPIDADASTWFEVSFYALPPLGFAAGLATWFLRWRRAVRVLCLLVSAAATGGWYALQLNA